MRGQRITATTIMKLLLPKFVSLFIGADRLIRFKSKGKSGQVQYIKEGDQVGIIEKLLKDTFIKL